MSAFGGKKLKVYDGTPVGSVVQSPINLEALTNGQWIALDGRDCNRGQYPELSPHFPAGVFTATARTLGAAPVAAIIVQDGTNFIASAAAGTTACQYSSAGSSWSNVTGFGASAAARAMVFAGTRTIVCGDGEAGMTGGGYAIAAGATSVSALTTGAATALAQGLAYSPSLGITVMVPTNGVGTAIYTLADGATTWAAQSHTTSRSKLGVYWTGQKFIIPCADAGNFILTSTDGATWVEQAVPFGFGSRFYTGSSDGNGTVVFACYNGGANSWFIASKDHGVTWRQVMVDPGARVLATTGAQGNGANLYLSYVNSRFIAVNNSGGTDLVSKDGLMWQLEPIEYGRGVQVNLRSMAYKAGVYCGIYISTTSVLTATEDMSKFRLPASCIDFGVGTSAALALHQEYIKARS